MQQPGARSLKTPENYAANQERRNVILGNMLAYGMITQEEHDAAVAIPVDENFVKPQPPRSGCMAANDYAKFFCDYVVNYLKRDPSLGKTSADREDLLLSGGLTVQTTLDPRFQTGTYPEQVPSYTTLDLYGRYNFTPDLYVSAAILNVTDEVPPYDPWGSSLGGTYLYDPALYDARGRQYRLGINYKFK